jgi:O-acetylhomoserine (thiol)-lyase
MHDETVAIHGAYEPDTTRAVAVPIYQTIAHEFDDAAHAGAVFDLEVPGFHYNRLNNPTNAVLEGRLQTLEAGAGAVLLSSGAAAVNYSILNLATAGDNIVTTPQLYGSTYTLFAYVLPGQGIEVRFAPDDRPESIEPLIDASTKAVFCESIGNPALNVVDLETVSELVHHHGVPLIVDNTIATPLYLKPINHGADVVVESLTKFVGGHGTTLGGAIIDAGRFPWSVHADKFPMFNRPEPAFHGVVYVEQFPEAPYAVRCRTVALRNTGSTLSPFSAFMLMQGLETLSVRLERHESNTRAIAAYLAADPRVEWLSWLGDPDFAYYELAQRYLKGRVPSILTFGVAGGYDAGIRFFDSVRLFKRLVNMGDAKSLVAHPASTTHRQLSPAALAQVGVAPEAIRLSIGIEHVDDLIADIDQALSAAL